MKLDSFKVRCSSLGEIMTNPRSGPGLSETCKTHLIELYVEHVYGRIKDVQTKYMEKGNKVEEDAITLYSRLKRGFFKKNNERLTNDFITGEPDLFLGKEIRHADKIIDTKSSWDLHTFVKAKIDKVNKNYYWQGMGYMSLTGAKNFTLAYCLINTPPELIMEEKRRLGYRLNVIDEFGNPDFIEGCEAIDRNSIFDDIPLHERMFEIQIERDEKAITAINERVLECRKWMSETFYPSESLTESLEKSVELTV